MAPSSGTQLSVLQAKADLAETKHTWADILVRGFTVLFGLTAAAHLAVFVWVAPHRLLVAGTLFSALAALTIWTVGMRHVETLQHRCQARQRAIDKYLNLPVS